MEERKTKFVIESYDNRKGSYIITEMIGYLPVYCYDGYLRGNTYHLYPRRCLIKGERRDKRVLSVYEVTKSLLGIIISIKNKWNNMKMKKILKKIKNSAQEWFCWLFCPEVLEAINDGCTYDEVQAVVRACVEKNFGGYKCRRKNT